MDDRSRHKGSRDPLGIEAIWSYMGRKMLASHAFQDLARNGKTHVCVPTLTHTLKRNLEFDLED